MDENNTSKIEQIKTADLIPYAKNSRTHGERQISQIAGSMREFGFTNPVLIDGDNGIIAGHGRVMAAQLIGMDTVPCIALAHLTETQKKAYIIADNKLAMNAGWDEEMLGLELADLQELDFDISLTGFDDADLAALLEDDDEEFEEDDQLIDRANPVTVLGDLWTMGDHRLLCGDSENQTQVEALSNGKRWDVCVFDPPYEVESLYETAMPKSNEGEKMIVFWDYKRFATAGHAAICAGWNPLYEFIWDNVTSWYTPNRPLARHKACGVFGEDPKWNFDKAIIKDGKKRVAKVVSNERGTMDYKPLDGAVHMRTVEGFPTTSEDGGHAHSKPMKWIIALFQGVGGNTYLDLFGGSGTTIIACEHLGLTSLTMELDTSYCDVIINRWQDYTGKEAIHESSGKTYAALKAKQES